MSLTRADSVFLLFILCISRVQGRSSRICALEGSSVELRCSASGRASTHRWHTLHWDGYRYEQHELTADGRRVTYGVSDKGRAALTISDLRGSDANTYCCRESGEPSHCRHRTELHVANVQVKVIPAAEGQTVTLMCSSSCFLTETAVVYVWYKNREFLYEDWSPWYQELVSSEEGVTYSCAVKGHEGLRAPDVSVDSVSLTCFTVTYSKGRTCSHQQTSQDEPCSITYPTEIHLQRTRSYHQGQIKLDCTAGCGPPSTPRVYMWYRNRRRYLEGPQSLSPAISSKNDFSCAVKGLEHLHSADVCAEENNCWSVNYISRRLCALEGSSVNVSCDSTRPRDQQPESGIWYKVRTGDGEEAGQAVEDAVRVEYHGNGGRRVLTISGVREDDSARYTFTQRDEDGGKRTDLPGVTLVVTGLKVKFSPSAVVAEGQRVKVSCSTSCPLPANTTYVWYLNGRQQQHQSKHLDLDAASSRHAGRYICAVKGHNVNSSEEALSVHTGAGLWASATAAGLVAALLVILPLSVFLWSRKKKKQRSGRAPAPDRCDDSEQLTCGAANDDVPAQRADDELHYSTVCLKKRTDPLYSSIQPRQPQEQEQVLYAAVKLRQNTS